MIIGVLSSPLAPASPKNLIRLFFQMCDTSSEGYYCNDYDRFIMMGASLMCVMMLAEAAGIMKLLV